MPAECNPCAPADRTCDVVIVGCGVAGLYTALMLPEGTRIIMLSKGAVDECDSMLAQGGICVLPDACRDVINDLVACGVDFARDERGQLAYTREGAHSRPRICFHGDVTGREITTKLLARVRDLQNVEILEHTAMVDLIEGDEGCAGVVALPIDEAASTEHATDLASRAEGAACRIFARATVLACGGIRGVLAARARCQQRRGGRAPA